MSEWNGKSKGSVLGYKFFILIIKTLGLGGTYFILRFVTFYYYIFAKNNRKAILSFYTEALGFSKKEARKTARKNFFYFGQTLVDRFAFLLNKADKITYSFVNESTLLAIKEKGEGAILLSAHVGNWETAGNLLKHRVSNRINVVMLDDEYEKIKDFVNESTGGSKFNVIPIKNDLSHIIKIKNALTADEFIAIHADRFMDGAKNIELNFFNKPVKFPYGPFLMASKFKVPVVFVFAVKENTKHYKLCAFTPKHIKPTPEQIAADYVSELEKIVKQHPEQWFNYYNYFSS